MRSSAIQDFQIRVKIHEARQLGGNNPSPVCKIKCNHTLKQTKKKRSTNNAIYDEIFSFDFHSSQSELFSKSN